MIGRGSESKRTVAATTSRFSRAAASVSPAEAYSGSVKLPIGLVLPIAYGAEAYARLTGKEPFVTVDGLKMAKYRMFFSSAKAAREFGYRARPHGEALRDALAWFRMAGYVA